MCLSPGKQPPQQDFILVLDTNILLSHLDYVKKMRSHGLGGGSSIIFDVSWETTCYNSQISHHYVCSPYSCSLWLPHRPDPLGGASGAGLTEERTRPLGFRGSPGLSCHLIYLQLFEKSRSVPVGPVDAAGC